MLTQSGCGGGGEIQDCYDECAHACRQFVFVALLSSIAINIK